MKMSKAKKRIMCGFLGVVLACTVFLCDAINNVTDVQATTKVLDGITEKYAKNTNPVNILEIVPADDVYNVSLGGQTNNINKKSELGYFMPFSNSKDVADYDSEIEGTGTVPTSIGLTSRGGVHGDPNVLSTRLEANNPKPSDAYRDMLVEYRQYGLIRPSGTDRGWYTKIGDYPIYANNAVFSTSYDVDKTPNTLPDTLVKGIYTLIPEGQEKNGEYNLDTTKYWINEDHQICEIVTSPVEPKPEEPGASSVSENSGENSVSEDNVEPQEPAEPTVSYKVLDIDTDAQQLPASKDGALQYITKAADGNGNVTFTAATEETIGQTYYGYSDLTIYYEADKTYHKNSDWFSEYVLGSNAKYKDTDMNYVVETADKVTVAQVTSADLVYISGKEDQYKKGETDIKDDVMLALYNQEINNTHKAIIMDRALYDEEKGYDSNVEKLAILLWQESADALISAYGTSVDGKDTLFVQRIENGVTLNEITEYAKLTDEFFDALDDPDIMILNRGNGNFVTGNVYVYNHHMADFKEPKAMVDAEDNFANGDFNSAYTSAVAAEGFSAVMNYINISNKNSLTGPMSTDITPAVVIQYILVSDGQELTAMKNALRVLEIQPVPGYLYNPGRGSVEYVDLDTKDDADIIANRKAFVDDYLSVYYADKIQYISFESMTVTEFNGRNEDLVESYDIVYIGDEMKRRDGSDLYYYTEDFAALSEPAEHEGAIPFKKVDDYKVISYVWEQNKSGEWDYVLKDQVPIPDYVDDNLDGNIYYNIGDIVNVVTTEGNANTPRTALYGLLDGQYEKIGKYNDVGNLVVSTPVRFNGRDITKNKLTKLEEFLDAKSLVIVAENLLGSKGNSVVPVINPTAYTEDSAVASDIHGRVDSSSNLYEFLKYGLGQNFNFKSGKYEGNAGDNSYIPYDNMVSAADIKRGKVDKAKLNQYVSAEKLSLILMEKPAEYAYTATDAGVIQDVTYLGTEDDNGTRYLEYKFAIASEMSTGESVGVSYEPHLYIDINNDGKYSKTTEDVADCAITVDGTGEEAEKDAETGEYILYKDNVYNLRRDLTDDYSGILKWKLDIQSNLSDSTHASEQGYTLVKNKGTDKQIRILQITKGTDNTMGGSNLNLENQLKFAENNKWHPYLNNIPGYDLHIKTMSVGDFEKDFDAKYAEEGAGKTVEDYALEYFQGFKVDDEVQGGVNMLVCGFGDDITPFTSYKAISAVKTFIEQGKPVLMAHDFLSFGADVPQNKALRQLIGMDLYGVTQNIATNQLDDASTTLLVNRWNAEGEEINSKDNANLNGVLHKDIAISRSGDGDDVRLNESLGKEVVYKPNSERKAILPDKQGYSNFMVERGKDYRDNVQYKKALDKTNLTGDEKNELIKNRNTTRNSWINDMIEINGNKYFPVCKLLGLYQGVDSHFGCNYDFSEYTIEKLNDGQITEYPYRIPQSFKTASPTHSQYYSLDLTSDADSDGESDVVVWYALGDSNRDPITQNSIFNNWQMGHNPYHDGYGSSLDPAGGYYIYNKGNVTYTGAGHEKMNDATTAEIQLFVNTLLASFEVGNTAPEVKFYETTDLNDEPINSVVVPYDGNITKPEAGTGETDSSVLKENGEYKYKFVDPNTNPNVPKSDGTEIFFRVKDINFVRGTKDIEVKYYLKVDTPQNGADYILNDGTKKTVTDFDMNGAKVVDISDKIYTYSTSGANITDNVMEGNKGLKSTQPYGFYLPMDYLNDRASFTIYIEARTTVTSVSTAGVKQVTETGVGYQELTVTKADLLDLD